VRRSRRHARAQRYEQLWFRPSPLHELDGAVTADLTTDYLLLCLGPVRAETVNSKGFDQQRNEGVHDRFVTNYLYTLATAQYVKVDDLLKASPALAPRWDSPTRPRSRSRCGP
jgi:hypothetical protein